MITKVGNIIGISLREIGMEKIAVVPNAIKAQRRSILGKFLGRDFGAAKSGIFNGPTEKIPDIFVKSGTKLYKDSYGKTMIKMPLGLSEIAADRNYALHAPHFDRTGFGRSSAIQRYYIRNNPEKTKQIVNAKIRRSNVERNVLARKSGWTPQQTPEDAEQASRILTKPRILLLRLFPRRS